MLCYRRMFLFNPTPEELLVLENRSAYNQNRRFSSGEPPPFDLGLGYLDINDSKGIDVFLKRWFSNPARFMKCNKQFPVAHEDGFLMHESILDSSRKVRFRYIPQKYGTPGRKVALLHVMYWNGRLRPYETIIRCIQNTGLPISVLIHVPAGRWVNPAPGDTPDYYAVSPNIGRTVFATRQHVQDIQHIVLYLKNKLGYEEVGLFSYSIGSLYGAIAAMMFPGLFDFAIFHTMADDFSEAVLGGPATARIAEKIRGNIDNATLSKMWSTISPGAYKDYFGNLPRWTRVIQTKYDYTFGISNVQRITGKLSEHRPDINLEIVPLSHTTFGQMPHGAKIMWNNLSFIYKHTQMREYKRSSLFI